MEDDEVTEVITIDNEKLFAIKLADNEKKTRDKALSKIVAYVQSRSSMMDDKFTELELIKLWKGLHYALWMCDKAIIQEELTNRICSLLTCFNNNDEQVFLFIKVFFKTIIREWNRIDKWRIDKFMTLVRLMLRGSFTYLDSKKWDLALIKKFNKLILEFPLNINDEKIPDGVSYHVSDVYLEELAKFGEKLKPKRAVKMLDVFFKSLATSTKKLFVDHLYKRMFEQIIECSDVGINDGDEDNIQNIKAFGLQIGEEEDKSEYSLKFDYDVIGKQLFKLVGSATCVTRNKKIIYDLIKKFRALQKNVYPIDVSLPDLDKAKKRRTKKVKKRTNLHKINNKKAVSKK